MEDSQKIKEKNINRVQTTNQNSNNQHLVQNKKQRTYGNSYDNNNNNGNGKNYSSSSGNKSDVPFACYKCGDPNHMKRNCPILAAERKNSSTDHR
ncbi:hypothetical protein IFM89_026774 [Coptis chinensis]|uniref:CCHC-type domain-containing protein n=1 Tax=Coptis chinensis TaxID=261450 RepID=A0A835IDL1_9MAGN|nr:hypothetical protein IFM89_026774 [Coptis chinensis]